MLGRILFIALSLLTGFATQAMIFRGGGSAHASLPPNLFADPRDYGATCGSGSGATTWNANNATNDDAPSVQTALNTFLPVVLPYPGCKFVTQVAAPAAGATLFSFAGPGSYDALTGSNPALTSPYIYVPAAANGSATNNCIFDTKGFDGVSWRNIVVIGADRVNGTSAFCNSVGIGGGRPQAFAHLNNVSITNMAGIGVATDSNCLPTGSLDVPVFQMTIDDLYEGHNCFGINANYSDTHINNWIAGNIYHACLASPSGAGISMEIVNFRCEYNGHYDGGPLYNDGAAYYLNGAFTHLTNGIFDHIYGSCIVWDGHNAANLASGWSGAVNVHCNNSNARDTHVLAATGSITGTTLNISAVSTGVVNVGAVITGAGIAANTTITAVGTGTGGTGTYTVTPSQTIGSEAIAGPGATYPCNYTMTNEASFITTHAMTALGFASFPPYNLCFSGTQARNITWESTSGDGPDGGGGWHTAFVNGTMPSNSHIEAAQWGIFDNRLPTSCSGLATGMQAVISNVINSCP